MANVERLSVEVAYATPAEQLIIPVEVAPGTSVEAAIYQSGILKRFPEIDLSSSPVGIFGARAGLADTVLDGQRIEIYRALRADPKTIRRQRARSDRKTRP
ncbi:MAG: RnfH family protein [Acidiferrobacterales bacterium]